MCCERSDVPYLPPAGWVDNESEYFASQTRNSLLSKLNRDDGMDVDMGGTERWKWKFRFMAVGVLLFFVFLASRCATPLDSATPAAVGARPKQKNPDESSLRGRGNSGGWPPNLYLVGWHPW